MLTTFSNLPGFECTEVGHKPNLGLPVSLVYRVVFFRSVFALARQVTRLKSHTLKRPAASTWGKKNRLPQNRQWAIVPILEYGHSRTRQAVANSQLTIKRSLEVASCGLSRQKTVCWDCEPVSRWKNAHPVFIIFDFCFIYL